MARTLLSTTCLVAFLLTQSTGIAFQSSSDNIRVSVTPRSRPKALPDSIAVSEAHLRIDSSLVEIPVHVTTDAGASVTSLSRQDFELFEEGIEQKITHFSQEDGPISIGLLFDASGSMSNKIRQSAEAAAAFFKTANANDEFFLVEFGDRPRLAVPFTTDSDSILRRIAHSRPFGRTSLLDAIQMAVGEMKRARNFRKAIVILSDGGDNRSRSTAAQIRSAMLEADLQVYAMGIFDPDPEHKHTAEEQNGPRLLDDLAEQTGGRLFRVTNLDDLPSVSARISRELRSQYVLGYSPLNETRDAKYRKVRLKVIAPEGHASLHTYYRRGYYAPSE